MTFCRRGLLALAMGAVLLSSGPAEAAEPAACGVISFVDATQYQAAETAARLQNIVQEKLLNSGAVSVRVVDELTDAQRETIFGRNQEKMLAVQQAMKDGNLNNLFENPALNGHRSVKAIPELAQAESVSPQTLTVLQGVGRPAEAAYLVTGVVTGYGVKNHGVYVPIVGRLSKAVAVNVDFYVIRVSDGKVVWQKAETGQGKKIQEERLLYSQGNTVLSEKQYMAALDNVSENFVKDLQAEGLSQMAQQ